MEQKSLYSDTSKCPECGKIAELYPPNKTKGKILIVRYKCDEGHIHTKEVTLK